MQYGAAIEVSAAVDQGHVIPKGTCCSFPKSNVPIVTPYPLTVGRVDIDRRVVECSTPPKHAGVEMRMRNRDGTNPTEMINFGDGGFVDQGNTIPQHIAARRLHQQRALTDREGRFGANSQQTWRLEFEPIGM